MNIALGYVTAINAARAEKSLPPLNLSIGLEAGAFSPINHLLLPPATTFNIALKGSNVGSIACLKIPDVWNPAYVSASDTAFQSLIGAVITYDSKNQTQLARNIRNVKVSPINLVSSEFQFGGSSVFATISPMDSGSLLPVGAQKILCPKQGNLRNNGASILLKGYDDEKHTPPAPPTYPDCRSYATTVQAYECVFGIAMGDIRAYLKQTSVAGGGTLAATIEAVPENNGSMFPDIDCGLAATGAFGMGSTCVVQGTRLVRLEICLAILFLPSHGRPVFN